MGMSEAQRKEYIEKFIWKDVPDDVKRMAWHLCEEYGLKPELKHLSLLWSKKRQCYTPYITRDGLLWVANNSGIKWGIQLLPPQIQPNPYKGEQEDIYLPCALVRDGFPNIEYGIWFSEYNTGANAWQTNPGTMHAKVGQVYGLRIGFNVCIPSVDENEFELGGYTPGATSQEPEDDHGRGGSTISAEEHDRKERKQLYDMAVEIGGDKAVRTWMREREYRNLQDCDVDVLNDLVNDMRRLQEPEPPARRESAPAASGPRKPPPPKQSSIW